MKPTFDIEYFNDVADWFRVQTGDQLFTFDEVLQIMSAATDSYAVQSQVADVDSDDDATSQSAGIYINNLNK